MAKFITWFCSFGGAIENIEEIYLWDLEASIYELFAGEW